MVCSVQVIDKHNGDKFGRDDVAILQRFAVQCGISLRNLGGRVADASNGLPTRENLAPRPGFDPRSVTPALTAPSSGQSGLPTPTGARAPPSTPRSGVRAKDEASKEPRTADAGVQCERVSAPELKFLAR